MIPTKAVSNRVVHHEVIAHWTKSFWSSEKYDTVLSGPIPDWSWRDKARYLEGQGAKVSIFRGVGRYRRKIYETRRSSMNY